MALKKPYRTEEIAKNPLAVAISLLIGLLLTSVTIITNLLIKVDDLRQKSENEKNARIEMYEGMIFYKNRAEELEGLRETDDSTWREKTQPFVNKILKQ